MHKNVTLHEFYSEVGSAREAKVFYNKIAHLDLARGHSVAFEGIFNRLQSGSEVGAASGRAEATRRVGSLGSRVRCHVVVEEDHGGVVILVGEGEEGGGVNNAASEG